MNRHRFFDALKKTILLSATIHLTLLVMYAIWNLDVSYINYFNMLDLEVLFPDLIKGTLSQVLAAIVMVGIFFIIYFRFTKKRDK